MAFIAWPEIEAFHHIRKFLRIDPTEWWRAKEQMHGTSTVTYKCKVKLHGTNAAVQVHTNGTIVCQSRESIITPEKDNAGFARWVHTNKDAWLDMVNRTFYDDVPTSYIIYGEWCGPGIQKNVAIAGIPKKIFAVFAIRALDEKGEARGDAILTDPTNLQMIVGDVVPDVYVLPWYRRPGSSEPYATVNIDWRKTDEEISQTIAPINDWVKEVEDNDPWVFDTFGIKGTGEGLVFYPVSVGHFGWESFQNLCFKAKGEKHKNIATAKPAQVSAEAAASISAFVEMVLTGPRLEQGARTIALTPGSYDQKQTGKFVAWCLADVEKECQDELEASKLEWKQVQKPLTDKARAWYLERARR